MQTVTITFPHQAPADDFEVKMMVAGGLFEKGKLSSGDAAEILGVSKRTFIELLGKYGFSIFGYNETEILEDLKNLKEWKKL